jgi:hypothetical protein
MRKLVVVILGMAIAAVLSPIHKLHAAWFAGPHAQPGTANLTYDVKAKAAKKKAAKSKRGHRREPGGLPSSTKKTQLPQ